MSFQWPLALLALLAIPLVLVALVLLRRRRMRYAVRFTNVDVLASVVGASPRWRLWIPPALFLLGLACASVAMARPEMTRSMQREQATVVLVLDSSGSMEAKDVEPTRFEAALSAVRLFLDSLPERYQVGLVTFATEPQVLASATHDRELVRESLEYIYPGMGTAIGDAIATGVDVARQAVPPKEEGEQESGDAAPVAIVMLSDGTQMGGELEPMQGAQRAKRHSIPVYTIALGTPEGVVEFERDGFTRTIPVPLDPVTLRRIADATGGRFYEAFDAEQLSGIYKELGSRLGRMKAKDEVTFAFSAGAALLLLADLIGRSALDASREIPSGVVTALLGAPLLLWLLRSRA